MTTDRRAYDPFAPFPVSPPAPPSPPLAAEPGELPDADPSASSEKAREAAEQLPFDLDEISKDDLIALAELADVASYGTKQQIADRIRAAARKD